MSAEVDFVLRITFSPHHPLLSLGPVVGPIGGGFLTQNAGYKWTFWLIAIAAGSVGVIAIIGLEETFAEVIRARVARKEGRVDCRSPAKDAASIGIQPAKNEKGGELNQIDMEKGHAGDSTPVVSTTVEQKHAARKHLITSLTRPLALLFCNYVCFSLSLYSAT